jgi:hypothetical protein
MSSDIDKTSRGPLMIKWVARNRAWLFSGIGVFLLSGLLKVIFQSTGSPSLTQPDALDVPKVVEAVHGNSSGLTSGDEVASKVPLDDYTKLFDGYAFYFVNSLKPNSVEYIVGDDIVKEVVGSTISVNAFGELHLSVRPMNYASLFRDQLRFFEFRDAVPPPSGRKEWGTYSDNPIDQLYQKIGSQVRANLRSYFSDRRRLESFYRAKKPLIREAIREGVPLALRSRFIGELDQVIESFQVVLKPSYRGVFEGYLDVERRYIAKRYGYVSEEDLTVYRQNVYDHHDGPVGSVYATLNKREGWEEKPVDHAQEEKLIRARKVLFDQSPEPKASAFAYRRYLEGGEELVEAYIAMLEDLKASAFTN